MQVKDLMSTVVEFTTPATSVKEAAHQMHETHVGVLPVLENDKVVGMITDRDICCKVVATGHSAGRTPVAEVMTSNVATCFDNQNIDDAIGIMIKNHVRRLAVVNQSSHLVGILSVDDVARDSHESAGSVLDAARQLH